MLIMAYGPIFSKTKLQGGKNIVASEHLQFVEAGATLDHTEFPKGFNEVGAQVARNLETGKFEPFTEAEGFDNFGILNEDFNNDHDQDLVAGEIIVRGSVYELKLPEEVTEDFKNETPMIRYVKHV